jgi:membrane protease YdiL (CAAX protease family)
LSFGENPLPPGTLSPLDEERAPQAAPATMEAATEEQGWGLWAVVRIAVVAMIAIGLFSMVAMAVALRGAPNMAPADMARNARVVIPAQFAAYLVVLAYMYYLVSSKRSHQEERAALDPLTAIGWNWPGTSWFGWMALGVGLALLVQSASVLLPVPKSLPIDRYFRDTVGAYMMAVFGLTFAPLVEELFFRGFLYPAVARPWGMMSGVVVTSALFAFIHASQLAHAWAPLLLLFFVGVVLTVMRARTGSVATTFLIHVGYNATLFGMLYVASDHFRHFEKLG